MSGTAKAVLVVEDEAVLALDLQRRLSRMGYFVPQTAASVAEAVTLCESIAPDIVLLDLRLQGSLHGIDAALQLRAHFDFALIYVTGGVDAEQLERAETTLPDAWLNKPYTHEQLVMALETAEARLEQRAPALPQNA